MAKAQTVTVIYAIECKRTGRRYIGSATNKIRRFQQHLSTLNTKAHCNPYLQNAWNKYGQDNFNFIVLEEINDLSLLYQKEQEWIDRTELKFNICPVAGSALGRPVTEETRQKLRAASGGRKHTSETIQKIKEALNSPEVKAKMLLTNNIQEARKKEIGRKFSEETKLKMSLAHKGHIKTPEHRANLSKAKLGKPLSKESIIKRTATRARNRLKEIYASEM